MSKFEIFWIRLEGRGALLLRGYRECHEADQDSGVWSPTTIHLLYIFQGAFEPDNSLAIAFFIPSS